MLLRKSFLLGLSTGLLGLEDPRAQLTYTMFLLSTFVGMQVHYKPLVSPLLNLTEALALVSELVFSFAVMIRQQGTTGERVFSADGGVQSSAAAALSASVVKLREVSPTERLIFDLAAAVFAVFFIVVWLFVFLNDKLFGGILLKRAVMVRDALVARKPSCRACGAAPAQPRLLQPVADTKHWPGWQLIRDPVGAPLWAPRTRWTACQWTTARG